MAPKSWNKRKGNRHHDRNVENERVESTVNTSVATVKLDDWDALNKIGFKIKFEGSGDEQKTVMENLEEICKIIHRDPSGKKFFYRKCQLFFFYQILWLISIKD